MNTIILLIYMSGFLDKIEWVLLFSFWSSLGITVLTIIINIDNARPEQDNSEINKEKILAITKNTFKKLKSVIIICFMSIFLYVVIPSQQTIYMISGVYVGNEVVQSETGKKVMKVIDLKLDEYINSQIKEGKSDKNDK